MFGLARLCVANDPVVGLAWFALGARYGSPQAEAWSEELEAAVTGEVADRARALADAIADEIAPRLQ